MRQQFIPLSEAKNKREAYKIAACAIVIAKVDGGWLAFSAYSDYMAWKKTKVR